MAATESMAISPLGSFSTITTADGHAIRYLSSCELLPPDTPFGFAHIVDEESIQEETAAFDLTAADGIATLLFKHNPKTLDKFLDPKNKKFSFDRRSTTSIFTHFFVGRIGNEVTVGLICLAIEKCMLMSLQCGFYNDRKKTDWDEKYKYSISYSGKWISLDMLDDDENEEDLDGGSFAASIVANQLWEDYNAKIVVS